MSLSYAKERPGPGLHALLIGPGAYPKVEGGQLFDPSASMLAIEAWLTMSYLNPGCPLASVEILASSAGDSSDTNMVTISNVEEAFSRWYERCSSLEENIAFFC